MTGDARLDRRVLEFLEGPRYAVLATINADGTPQLTEMWFGVRDGDVFFNTTEERQKPRNVARDPRVSLLVSERKGGVVWQTLAYVRIDGVARLVTTGAAALEDIVALAIRYDGPSAEAAARRNYSTMHRATYVIAPRRVYAKGL